MSTLTNTDKDHTWLAQFTAATVVGLGATGFSVVRYLCARGLSVSVVDTRNKPPMADDLVSSYPNVETLFGSLNVEQVKNAELLVVSPGLSLKEPALLEAKRNGALIVGDIELFLKENNAPVIAITGSNGKSTVTTLVGKMCESGDLKALVAGNIGTPALNALTDDLDYDIAVLELSSFQLETTTHVPATAATILNISADHMDRYDSMGDYVLAKARVLRGAERAILPRHEEHLEQITNINKCLRFGLDKPASEHDFGVVRKKSGRWLMKGDKRLMMLRDIPLVGLHNVANVLTAFALVDFLDIELERLVNVVVAFQGLPHRMQTVSVVNQVTWVNDSKATNIGATSTALQNLEGDVYWLAGGEGKGADFTELKTVLPGSVKLAILFGKDADAISTAVSEKVETVRVESLQAAVTLAHEKAEPGSVVLLSPACASFDMFKDFEDRGDQFRQAVSTLLAANMPLADGPENGELGGTA